MPISREGTALTNDALPYVDATHQDYDEYAAYLLEEEMKETPPRTAEPLAAIRYRSPLMEGEYQRVTAAKASTEPPMPDTTVVPAPTADTLEAWEAAVQRAKIAHEKERIRGTVIDICREGSTSAEQWRSMNAQLEALQASLATALQAQTAAVEAIHLARKSYQEQTQQELHVLTAHFGNLVLKTQQLKHAIALLKKELGTL
jgi:flagellar biosynthesis chaperone FliJ